MKNKLQWKIKSKDYNFQSDCLGLYVKWGEIWEDLITE
jgi:hypothetical protein